MFNGINIDVTRLDFETRTAFESLMIQMKSLTDYLKQLKTAGNLQLPSEVKARRLISTIEDGQPPIDVNSKTIVKQLNADLLDGLHVSDIIAQIVVDYLSNYILSDGTTPLTADWGVGDYKITAKQLAADIASGTAPLIITSPTKVDNLNSDKWDGYDLDVTGAADNDPVIFDVTNGTLKKGTTPGISVTKIGATQTPVNASPTVDTAYTFDCDSLDRTIYQTNNKPREIWINVAITYSPATGHSAVLYYQNDVAAPTTNGGIVYEASYAGSVPRNRTITIKTTYGRQQFYLKLTGETACGIVITWKEIQWEGLDYSAL